MKKIISLVLALALVCGLAVNAFAANLGVSVNNGLVEAGEEVVVTVTIDETIENVTSVQAVLTYDKAVLTYVGATAGEGYGYLGFTASNRKDEIKINSGSDFSLKTLPAGTVAVVTFTANEALEAADLALTISMTTGLENGDSVDVPGASVVVTVCPGHNYIETKSEATCLEPATVTYTCEYCGHSYKGESDEVIYGDHDLEYVPATNTCTEDGLKEHYLCTVCGKMFEVGDYGDMGAELTEADLFAPAAHKPYNAEEVMEDGTIIETPVCAICEEVLGDPIVVHQLFSEDCPTTINIAAGETVNYNAYGFGGYSVLIYGDNLTVTATSFGMWGQGGTTETYTSVNGVVTVPLSSGQARLVITNNGGDAAVEVKVLIPVGDEANPAVLYDGTNTFAIPEDTIYDYYTYYTPYCDGELTITVTGNYWNFTVNVPGDPEDWSDDIYGDQHSHQDEEAVNTETIAVKAGYPVKVILSTVHVTEDWEWLYPATTLNVEVSFVPTHNIIHVDAKAASCFEEGNIEYWYCDICGAAWADEALTQVTNLMSVVTPASCPEIIHVEAKAPSCFEEGNIEYWYCANEEHGTVWIDEALMQISNHLSVKIPAACPEIVHMEAVAPGCHYDGHVEHWYCTNPDHGTVWVDEALTQVSNHKAVILPALGGEVVHVEAADANCTQPGHIEYWYCEECDQVWQDEALTQLTNRKNVITEAATGHVYDDDKDMICNVCEFDRTNSQTGDAGIIVAAAAAIISATGVVALPIAKKKFF